MASPLTVRAAILLIVAIFALILSPVSSSPSSSVPLRFAIRVRSFSSLASRLLDEPPASVRHYTLEEMREKHGATKEDIQAITEWINTLHPIPASISVAPGHDFITAAFPRARVPAILALSEKEMHEQVEIIFPARQQQFHVETLLKKPAGHHHHQGNKRTPRGLTNKILKGGPASVAAAAAAPANALVVDNTVGTPANQRLSYYLPASVVGNISTNIQMVYGTGTYGYLASDLVQYYAGVGVSASELKLITAANSMAGTTGGDNWGEAMLDVSCISGLATGITTVVYNNDNSSATEDSTAFGLAFLSFVSDFNSLPLLPNVISLSLGSLSWDSCNLLCSSIPALSNGTYSYADCVSYMAQQRQVCMFGTATTVDRIDQELAKINARGTTITAASGDGGSHFSFQFFPSDPMGTLLNTVSCEYSLPTYPSDSPWVVSVGGSDWSTGGYAAPEGWAASGSGASRRFAMPNWQTATARQYFANAGPLLPPASSYNASMRLYPDVAALATNVPVVMQGQWTTVGGTSAAAPEVAALISLLNQERLSRGLATIGFMNARLYQAASLHYGEMFTDMTQGNSACESSGNCCATGFPALKGWDMTTGFGQPIWTGWVKYMGSD